MDGLIRRPSFSPNPPIPFPWGGNGRYIYVLNCGDQTVSVIDSASDTVVNTIALAVGKDFCSIFYRSVNETVLVCSNSWMDTIDANPDSPNFNAVIKSVAFVPGSATATIMSYLPFPFDFLTTGGSSAEIPDGPSESAFISEDSRWGVKNIRVGGHSNSVNIIVRPSGGIYVNGIEFRARHRGLHRKYALFEPDLYFIERDPVNVSAGDLQAFVYPPIKFKNFFVAITGTNCFLLSNDPSSYILHTLNTIGGSNRSFSEYCPNAPDRLFISYQITNNLLSVIQFDYTNKVLVDLGDIDRTAYKATGESGCNNLLYNPYSGHLYAQAHNNIGTTPGVNKIHVYDPTQPLLANMYQKSIQVGEMLSATRTSLNSLNTMCMNRLRCYEYPNIRM